MLGPFYSRGNGNAAPIGPEKWQRLVAEEGYSDVASDKFPSLGVVVRTRWIGHDREDNSPPRIFLTTCMGDQEVSEVATATELEALNVHAAMCARYREQTELIASGGAPLLTDGVL